MNKKKLLKEINKRLKRIEKHLNISDLTDSPMPVMPEGFDTIEIKGVLYQLNSIDYDHASNDGSAEVSMATSEARHPANGNCFTFDFDDGLGASVMAITGNPNIVGDTAYFTFCKM